MATPAYEQKQRMIQEEQRTGLLREINKRLGQIEERQERLIGLVEKTFNQPTQRQGVK